MRAAAWIKDVHMCPRASVTQFLASYRCNNHAAPNPDIPEPITATLRGAGRCVADAINSITCFTQAVWQSVGFWTCTYAHMHARRIAVYTMVLIVGFGTVYVTVFDGSGGGGGGSAGCGKTGCFLRLSFWNTPLCHSILLQHNTFKHHTMQQPHR